MVVVVMVLLLLPLLLLLLRGAAGSRLRHCAAAPTQGERSGRTREGRQEGTHKKGWAIAIRI